MLANNIRGYLQALIVTFLMNYHVHPRSIWITRHGESIANTQGLLGGDSGLSEKGHRYAAALGKFGVLDSSSLDTQSNNVLVELNNIKPVELWTSTLTRTRQTSLYIELGTTKHLQISGLNEIYAGSCEGMTYKEVEEQMPEVTT